MPSQTRLEIFLKKNWNQGPKIHCLAIKLYTDASKIYTGDSKSEGGADPDPPGSTSGLLSFQLKSLDFHKIGHLYGIRYLNFIRQIAVNVFWIKIYTQQRCQHGTVSFQRKCFKNNSLLSNYLWFLASKEEILFHFVHDSYSGMKRLLLLRCEVHFDLQTRMPISQRHTITKTHRSENLLKSQDKKFIFKILPLTLNNLGISLQMTLTFKAGLSGT